MQLINNTSVGNKGGKTLGGLNFGCDKIQLDDEYGHYLLNKIMKLESSATLPN